MKVYSSSKEFPKTLKNPIVTLGNFDGVHLAHQKMFQLANQIAKKHQGHSVVYTFDPHPVKVLSKASKTPMINTLEQKLEFIGEMKIHAVVLEPFKPQLAQMEPQVWFEKILVERLHAHTIVAGYDFTFGKRRLGTVELLHQLAEKYGIACEILDAQMRENTLISSTQIRQFVLNGEVKLAKELLGRPFCLDGEVIQGFGRGAEIGIPTANLKVKNELIPEQGVYVCQAKVGDKIYGAVTNIGMNPTFGGKSLSIEAHLLDFNQDIYQEPLRIYFLDKIRGEKNFSSIEELVAQIKQDIGAAKRVLGKG